MKCIKNVTEPKIKPMIILKKLIFFFKKLLMQQTSSVAHKSRCFPCVSSFFLSYFCSVKNIMNQCIIQCVHMQSSEAAFIA